MKWAKYEVDANTDEPLLWVIRDHIGLTGTKYGCGVAQCGACTVHIDGRTEGSCQIPAKTAQGKKITTTEGIPERHPVKKRPGSLTMSPNAVTASRGRSWRQQPCWQGIHDRAMRT